MTAQLRFFGTAGYELLTADGVRVVMDPTWTRTRPAL